ncbi:NADP-dependent oxidoreductase domain-containing protein [Kockiozyma suomiensis]|uniref:NADP-dependent oxidoreductase domain-containing protein n=1 Tax=Kockiozyma suomiensis TaxID=1337062 RepID=UPI003343A87B
MLTNSFFSSTSTRTLSRTLFSLSSLISKRTMVTPSVTLSGTGRQMPLVGFGIWKVPQETCAETVYNAIKSGYRLIDGAQDYGNEKEAGEGVRKAIADGLVTREELFITSKLWNTFHSKENVLKLTKKSLDDWGLDYFDLWLIHFPIAQKYVDPAERYPPNLLYDVEKGTMEFEDVPISETWSQFEEAVKLGYAKNIGVSNFAGALLIDLYRYAKIKPSVLQIEHHPYLTQPQMIALAKQLGIAITGYSSFGPQSFLEMGSQAALDTPLLMNHDVITTIAKAHSRTPAQVILRWATQRGVAVIPKSNNPQRLGENLNHTDFDLAQAELDAISALNIGLRFNDPADWPGHIYIFA